MAIILTIANQKGGVGKTTTSVNLAAGLARHGKRVLLVDLDPQGNATMGSGIDKRRLSRSLYHVLIGHADVRSASVDSEVGGYRVLPANRELAGAEIEMVDLDAREGRLRTALQPVQDEFDFILIDAPPSLSILTLNGLCAANGVIIPMQCEYFALEGLSDLVNTIRKVHANFNTSIRIIGILRVMFDRRMTLSQQVSAQLEAHFKDKVFTAVVPRNVRLAEAPSHGMPGVVFDENSRGAQAYLQFAAELIEKMPMFAPAAAHGSPAPAPASHTAPAATTAAASTAAGPLGDTSSASTDTDAHVPTPEPEGTSSGTSPSAATIGSSNDASARDPSGPSTDTQAPALAGEPDQPLGQTQAEVVGSTASLPDSLSDAQPDSASGTQPGSSQTELQPDLQTSLQSEPQASAETFAAAAAPSFAAPSSEFTALAAPVPAEPGQAHSSMPTANEDRTTATADESPPAIAIEQDAAASSAEAATPSIGNETGGESSASDPFDSPSRPDAWPAESAAAAASAPTFPLDTASADTAPSGTPTAAPTQELSDLDQAQQNVAGVDATLDVAGSPTPSTTFGSASPAPAPSEAAAEPGPAPNPAPTAAPSFAAFDPYRKPSTATASADNRGLPPQAGTHFGNADLSYAALVTTPARSLDRPDYRPGGLEPRIGNRGSLSSLVREAGRFAIQKVNTHSRPDADRSAAAANPATTVDPAGPGSTGQVGGATADGSPPRDAASGAYPYND